LGYYQQAIAIYQEIDKPDEVATVEGLVAEIAAKRTDR
jgi:hypothetical protein